MLKDFLLQFFLSVAPLLVAFALTYYIKDKVRRDQIFTKMSLVAEYAARAVRVAEDVFGSGQGFEKLKYATGLLQQFMEKIGMALNQDEAEQAVRAAYQDSPYAKT
jgi:hypothetical protein